MNLNYDYSLVSSLSFWLFTLLFSVMSYLVGSINFGRIVGKLNKTDITSVGSGNIGATNAGRALGKKGFILVFLGDMFKVIFIGGIIHLIMIHTNIVASMPAALSFAILGNNFPIYWKFKGGKGVSAFYGWAGFVSWPAALVGGMIMAITLFLTRRVSVSSICAVTSVALFATFQSLFLPQILIPSTSNGTGVMIGAWIGVVLVTSKHYKNIHRVLIKKEVTVDGVKELRWVMVSGVRNVARDAVTSIGRAVKDTGKSLVMPHKIPYMLKRAKAGIKERWGQTLHNIKNPGEAYKNRVEKALEERKDKLNTVEIEHIESKLEEKERKIREKNLEKDRQLKEELKEIQERIKEATMTKEKLLKESKDKRHLIKINNIKSKQDYKKHRISK